MVDDIRQYLQSTDPALENALSALHNGTLSPQAFLFYVHNHHGIHIVDEAGLNKYLDTMPPRDLPVWDPEPPLVSFIIPTYNRAEMLCQAVDSVLAQTYPNLEILIIDDCSPDDTRDVIAQRYNQYPQVKYFRNEKNLHAGRSRRRGFQLAAGEYMVFLDDDDFYVDPDFIALAMLEHLDNPDLSFVCANGLVWYTASQEVDIGNLSFTGTIDSCEYLAHFQLGYKKPYSTFPAVFRKSILDQAELDAMEMMNDGPIYLRALLFGQVCSLPHVVGVYRLHGRNITYGLSADFIIANLIEKVWVYRKAQERNLLSNSRQWLYDQLHLTLHYYIYDTRPGYQELSKVVHWLKTLPEDTGRQLLPVVQRMWLRSRITRHLRPIRNLLLTRNKSR